MTLSTLVDQEPFFSLRQLSAVKKTAGKLTGYTGAILSGSVGLVALCRKLGRRASRALGSE